MRNLFYLLVLVVVFSVAVPVYAQNGCVNSPENPTALLALVGSAGGALVALRGRFGRKK
ncbi:MAG: PExPT-CTERM protein [Acidobacteriota bacterium]